MSFAPEEAYQSDWSHETITLAGLPLTVKAAHMKLSNSRMPFVRVYFRETLENGAGRLTSMKSPSRGVGGDTGWGFHHRDVDTTRYSRYEASPTTIRFATWEDTLAMTRYSARFHT
jgi:hypothetical protein